MWSPGEPSNGATPEHVGMILLDNRVINRNQVLGDIYASYPLNFICEVKYFPFLFFKDINIVLDSWNLN
jgi:hypothetical protein